MLTVFCDGMCSPDILSEEAVEWGSFLNRWWSEFSMILSLHCSYSGMQVFPGLVNSFMQAISRLVADIPADTAACLAPRRDKLGAARGWEKESWWGAPGASLNWQKVFSTYSLFSFTSWCWGWVADPCLVSIGQSPNVSAIKQFPSWSLCKSVWTLPLAWL